MPDHPDRQYSATFRVRYVECDSQGVVFNGHYFAYFDVAMTEFFRQLIGSYSQVIQAGADMVVAEARARYYSPARFDEEIAVSVMPTHVGNTSLIVELGVKRGPELLVDGELRYVFVDLQTTRKRPIPREVRAALVRVVPEGVSASR
jgi:acyl-CoA thioester hydrolase